MVSDAGKLNVKFVRIRNVNGFSGDYDFGLDGNAQVVMSDTTYDINGTAVGYSPKSIQPTEQRFRIEVAC
jgi:hypothetical protein